MNAMARALPWAVWRHHSWWLSFAAVYYIATATLSLTLPHQEGFHAVIGLMSSPVVFFAIWVMGEFSFGQEMDLSSSESGFPNRLFSLPITNRSLVLWPMVYGCLALAATFLLYAVTVLHARGARVDLAWPTFFCAGLMAWVQAIVWMPFPHSWIRVVTAIGGLTVYITVVAVARDWGSPEWLVCCILAVQLPFAYLVALRGVTLARTGESSSWRLPSILDVVRTRTPDLKNRWQAQAWYESQLNGLSLPVITSVLSLALLTIWVFQQLYLGEGSPVFFFAIFPVLCLVVSQAFSRFQPRLELKPLVQFLATRPITTSELFAAKVRAMFKSVIVSLGIITTSVLIMSLSRDTRMGFVKVWQDLTERLSPESAVVVVLAGVLASPVFCVLLIGTNVWSGLTGRKWVVVVQSAIWIGLTAAGTIVGCWAYTEPQNFSWLIENLPAIVGIIAKLRVALFIFLLVLVARLRIYRFSLMVGFGLAWAGMIAATSVILWHLLADTTLQPFVVNGTIIAMPGLGFVAAPLALHWNRHRG